VIVRPDVQVPGRGIDPETFDLADDRLVLRPATGQLVGAFDCVLQQIKRGVGAFRLEVRVFVPALVIALDKRLVERPPVAARVGEVIVGVDAGENAFGMVLADRMRGGAERQRGRNLHLVEQAIAQRLLVERDVVATPYRGEQQIRL